MKFSTRMLRSILLAGTFAAGVANSFADIKMYMAESIVIEPGTTKDVEIFLDNDEVVNAGQFELKLPKGLTCSKVVGNTERFDGTTLRYNDNIVLIYDKPAQDGNIGHEGVLCTMTLSADDTFTGGSIEFADVVFALVNEEYDNVTIARNYISASAPQAEAYVSFDTPVTEMAMRVGQTYDIALSLENDVNVKALNGVITLPKGIKPAMKSETRVDYKAAERLGDVDLAVSKRNESTVTFLISDFGLGVIEAGNGEIFTLKVEVTDELAETADIKIAIEKVSDPKGNALGIENGKTQTISVINQTILDQKAEAARQEANQNAAADDYAYIENSYWPAVNNVINGNEAYITPEVNAVVQEMLGDKYPSAIQNALDAVANEGIYTSPIDRDALAAEIDALKKAIEDEKIRQEGEPARQAANLAAAEDDMAFVEGIQEQTTAALKGNEDYQNEETKALYEDLLSDSYGIAIRDALEAVADEGRYVSPINRPELNAKLEALKAAIENAKKAAEQAEAARQAANQAAAEDDMAFIEGVQAEVTEALKGNEEYQTEDTKAIYEELLGDKYPVAIEEALNAVAEEGEYVSPLDRDAINAAVDALKKAIEDEKARQDAEAARQAANQAAAEDDMSFIENNYWPSINGVINGNEEYITPEVNAAIQEMLGDKYPMAIQEAFDAVAEEGEYVSPIDRDALAAEVDALKASIENEKARQEEERKAANEAAYLSDLDLLKALSDSYNATVLAISSFDKEYISTDECNAVRDNLVAVAEAVEKAYKDCATQGRYISPIEYEALQAEIAKLLDDTKARAIQGESEKAAAVVEALQEALTEALKAIPEDVAEDAGVLASTAAANSAVQAVNDKVQEVMNADGYDYTDALAGVDDAKALINAIADAVQAAKEASAITGIAVDAADTVVYDMSGRRVSTMQKGRIYIVNGKKTMIR